MALIESKPAFKQRCLQFGIPDTEIALLDTGGQATFGAFAFIIPFANKDSADADEKLKAGMNEILGAVPTSMQMTRYRRLLFESHAVVMTDAKTRMDRTEDTLPRKLPAPERSQRHKEQVAKYPGISVAGWNEPSHSLLDECQGQLEDQTVRYISLDKCTCRMQELDGVKKIKEAKEDNSGYLRVSPVDANPTFDHQGDMFKVRQALLRRALAYDSCGICSFNILESWSNKLFDTLQREPPPGFGRVSLWQALSADKELFSRIADKCRDGLSTTAEGKLPMELAILDLIIDVHLNQFLVHMPQGTGHRHQEKTRSQPYVHSAPSNLNHPQAANSSSGKGKNRRKEKGSGKGKGNRSGPVQMMAGLEGCWYRVGNDAVCQFYNLGRCNQQDKDKCSKGVHRCCKPKCGGAHPYVKCPGS